MFKAVMVKCLMGGLVSCVVDDEVVWEDCLARVGELRRLSKVLESVGFGNGMVCLLECGIC